MSNYCPFLSSISQLIGTKKIESMDVIAQNNEEGYDVSPVNSDINVLPLVKVYLSRRRL
jgi:hypothetical protein